MTILDPSLRDALRTLKLTGMLQTLDARLTQTRDGTLGHLEFLQVLCEDEIARRVKEAIALVHLTGKEEHRPTQLSGGQQQRVAVARALAGDPLILLADEPTGNLDPATSLDIVHLLDRINRAGTTIVMATHDSAIVNAMRRRVIELHEGRVIRDVADGSYDPALTPDEARPDVADVTWEPEANEDIDPAAGYEGGA